MIEFTLETLVLRGVVRTGELGVLRLFGVEASGHPGAAAFASLPPARTGPDTDPANPMVGYPAKGSSPRAGRSCRQSESVSLTAASWRMR